MRYFLCIFGKYVYILASYFCIFALFFLNIILSLLSRANAEQKGVWDWFSVPTGRRPPRRSHRPTETHELWTIIYLMLCLMNGVRNREKRREAMGSDRQTAVCCGSSPSCQRSKPWAIAADWKETRDVRKLFQLYLLRPKKNLPIGIRAPCCISSSQHLQVWPTVQTAGMHY